MRLLYLTHRLPYPPHKGEKIRAWNILKFLAERHEVSLACLDDGSEEVARVAPLRSYVRELLIQRIHPQLSKAVALSALFRSQPMTLSYFYSRALQRRIDALIDRERIEAVLCSCSPMAAYVFRSRYADRMGQLLRVMDLMDVDSHKWRQYAEASSFWTAWLYRREACNLAAFEQRIARDFQRILVVSERERRYFPTILTPERLVTMPNGVDLEYFSSDCAVASNVATIPPTTRPTLVFTGVMSYRPNVEGILWFADSVLPRVQAEIPHVQFYVVGSHPGRRVLRLRRRVGITVTGHVHDVRPYLAAATACVVPLHIARGLQNKVLEAMAMGRAVITTAEAFEGIEAEPGRDLLVADGENAFAAAVIEVLQNDERRAQIGRNARACVERRYSWRANLQPLDELFPSGHSAARPMDRSAESSDLRVPLRSTLNRG